MKKKELLIIFALAVLVTGLSCLYCHPGEGVFDVKFCGWPVSFTTVSTVWITFKGNSAFFWKEFLTCLLFWFLVLAAGWWVVRWTKKVSLDKI